MPNTHFFPCGLVKTGPQARNCQELSSQILALSAFQNLAPEALQLAHEKKKGPSLKSQSVQVCVFHENEHAGQQMGQTHARGQILMLVTPTSSANLREQGQITELKQFT